MEEVTDFVCLDMCEFVVDDNEGAVFVGIVDCGWLYARNDTMGFFSTDGCFERVTVVLVITIGLDLLDIVALVDLLK